MSPVKADLAEALKKLIKKAKEMGMTEAELADIIGLQVIDVYQRRPTPK